MQKNCQLVFQHFSFDPPSETLKKSCRNEFKFWEASRNHKSSSCWKFHNSILKNAKTSQLLASISEKVVPLYETLALYVSAFWAFMALGIKFLQLPDFLCQKGKSQYVNKTKKIFKMEVWSLVWLLKNFLAFFKIFLRSMIPKKFSGMQKSYIGIWIVFNPNHKPNENPHSSSLWLPLVFKSTSFRCLSCQLKMYGPQQKKT